MSWSESLLFEAIFATGVEESSLDDDEDDNDEEDDEEEDDAGVADGCWDDTAASLMLASTQTMHLRFDDRRPNWDLVKSFLFKSLQQVLHFGMLTAQCFYETVVNHNTDIRSEGTRMGPTLRVRYRQKRNSTEH